MKENLNPLLGSIDEDNLSEDDIALLKEEAIELFNKIPISNFTDFNEDQVKTSISKDHNTSRKILTNNINKLEKLTELIFDKVAVEPDNVMLIQSATTILSEQSKSLKLLHELQNKMIANKILAEKEKPGDSKKSQLPAGLS